MAHTQLDINFDTPSDSVITLCQLAELLGNDPYEVYYSFHALQVWKEYYIGRVGLLRGCVHHSNPDDPPDLTFNFDDDSIGVEHTRLQPQHLGWANAIRGELFRDRASMSIHVTDSASTRDELVSRMSGVEPQWESVASTAESWALLCIDLVRRKLEASPAEVIVVQETNTIDGRDITVIVQAVDEFLQNVGSLFEGREVILHSYCSPVSYVSYLFSRNSPVKVIKT